MSKDEVKDYYIKDGPMIICNNKHCWRCIRWKKRNKEMKTKGMHYFGQGLYMGKIKFVENDKKTNE